MWAEENNRDRSSQSEDFHNPDLRSEGIQVELIGSKKSKNFATAFEGLKLCSESIFDSRNEMLPPEKPVQTLSRCPCGCLKHGGSVTGFRTRELSSLRLVVHGPEILNYQGTKQAPEDIAPYWKKDSRMWLWKSVRLARRTKNKCGINRGEMAME